MTEVAKAEHVLSSLPVPTLYRGIAKNGAQVFSLLALANLYLARRKTASA